MSEHTLDDEESEHSRLVRREERGAITARQDRAWELRFVHGFTTVQVAEALGLGLSQTKKDLAAARRRRIEEMQKDAASHDDATLFKCAVRDRLEMAYRQASLGLMGSRPGTTAHIGYVAATLKAVEAQLKLGVALGMLSKADEDARYEMIAGLDPNRLSDEELRLLREMFAEARRLAAEPRNLVALPPPHPSPDQP